ncbi:hypothetical protein [Variovorax sp. OAS795]|uniref:hypothetical protein n=1 Tax=Variovorax sp. OAS795 TaxID=3034231 RepID=UPI0033997058
MPADKLPQAAKTNGDKRARTVLLASRLNEATRFFARELAAAELKGASRRLVGSWQKFDSLAWVFGMDSLMFGAARRFNYNTNFQVV